MDIASARKAKGWSQEDLARELGLRSKSYICEIENVGEDAKPPSLKVAIGIYRKLGVKHARIADMSEREIAVLEKALGA